MDPGVSRAHTCLLHCLVASKGLGWILTRASEYRLWTAGVNALLPRVRAEGAGARASFKVMVICGQDGWSWEAGAGGSTLSPRISPWKSPRLAWDP